MRTIRVYCKNQNTGSERSIAIQEKSGKGLWNTDRTLSKLIRMQKKQDILGLGHPSDIESLGIRDQLYYEDGVWRTWDIHGDSRWNQPIKFSKDSVLAESEIYLAFEMYLQGYVLEMSQESSSGTFYYSGQVHNQIKICESKDKAQAWISPKYMTKWCRCNLDMLKFFADRGWRFRILPNSLLSYREEMEMLSAMRPSDIAQKQHQFLILTGILDEIGAMRQSEDVETAQASEVHCHADEIANEAAFRMSRLGIDRSIINEFRKSGRIYMSEYYGYATPASERAMQYAKRIENIGLFPYHIARSHVLPRLGETYHVFYVSKNRWKWEEERQEASGSVPVWTFGNRITETSVITAPLNGGVIITDGVPLQKSHTNQ